ncbi:hypothetical protein Q7C36_007196 [Tachysurus vachellii]|uniref:Uncharacterized protein n=1 Tax=Tachysurus vachellii TaxID=175792 RepID=A0AA88NFQ5_TACVA|nr:hypothetical protein Q7C36_007196 [Tachysurus vachellii]
MLLISIKCPHLRSESSKQEQQTVSAKERKDQKKKHKDLSDTAKGSIPVTSWLRRENKDDESCSSDKESIEEIQGKAVETSEKDKGDVRANEEESGEIQGDIRLSEEEVEREVQEEMSQENYTEITEEGAAGADIEYQIQGMERNVGFKVNKNAVLVKGLEMYKSLS